MTSLFPSSLDGSTTCLYTEDEPLHLLHFDEPLHLLHFDQPTWDYLLARFIKTLFRVYGFAGAICCLKVGMKAGTT